MLLYAIPRYKTQYENTSYACPGQHNLTLQLYQNYRHYQMSSMIQGPTEAVWYIQCPVHHNCLHVCCADFWYYYISQETQKMGTFCLMKLRCHQGSSCLVDKEGGRSCRTWSCSDLQQNINSELFFMSFAGTSTSLCKLGLTPCF